MKNNKSFVTILMIIVTLVAWNIANTLNIADAKASIKNREKVIQQLSYDLYNNIKVVKQLNFDSDKHKKTINQLNYDVDSLKKEVFKSSEKDNK